MSFVNCCQRHAHLRRLDDWEATYWVCGYANRQHELELEIGADDITASSFYHALQVASGLLLILDKEAKPFSRTLVLSARWLSVMLLIAFVIHAILFILYELICWISPSRRLPSKAEHSRADLCDFAKLASSGSTVSNLGPGSPSSLLRRPASSVSENLRYEVPDVRRLEALVNGVSPERQILHGRQCGSRNPNRRK